MEIKAEELKIGDILLLGNEKIVELRPLSGTMVSIKILPQKRKYPIEWHVSKNWPFRIIPHTPQS